MNIELCPVCGRQVEYCDCECYYDAVPIMPKCVHGVHLDSPCDQCAGEADAHDRAIEQRTALKCIGIIEQSVTSLAIHAIKKEFGL